MSATLEVFKDRLQGLCEELEIDAAFFVIAVGRDVFGATVRRPGPATAETKFIEIVEQVTFASLNGGSLPSGYKPFNG
jgi:hypothetical protein